MLQRPVRIFGHIVFQLGIQTPLPVLASDHPSVVLVLIAAHAVPDRGVDDLTVHVLAVHLMRAHHGAIEIPFGVALRHEAHSLIHRLVVLLTHAPFIWSLQQFGVPVLVERESGRGRVVTNEVHLRVAHEQGIRSALGFDLLLPHRLGTLYIDRLRKILWSASDTVLVCEVDAFDWSNRRASILGGVHWPP